MKRLRNLTVGNKRMFIMFAMIIVIIIGVLVISLSTVLSVDKEKYKIPENSIIFDKEYNMIKLERECTLYKKWDGNFYLKDQKEEYKIGKQGINYIQNQNKMEIYGNIFEIEKGGAVTKTFEQKEIKNLKEDRLYKLEDRKYILTGENIQNENKSINTENFLIVQIDKSGNTLISNYELNMKTIKPIIINTETFKFDIANEKMIFDKEEIDLKKIIGSTNNYKEIKKEEDKKEEDKQEDDEKEKEENEIKEQTQSNQEIPNNTQNNPIIPEKEENNQTNIPEQNQPIITPPIINNPQIPSQDKKPDKKENKVPLAKSINLRGATAKSTSIDIEYVILDPENRYQTIFLDVQGNLQKTIALDKKQRNYIITGLTPNTEYKITISYKEILPDNKIVEGKEDSIIIKTNKISDTIKIDKLSKDKIYFTYKMDKDFVYEKGKIVLYIDGEKKEEKEINIKEAISSKGWKGVMKNTYGNEIILKLEGTTYEGKPIKRELQTKLKMY